MTDNNWTMKLSYDAYAWDERLEADPTDDHAQLTSFLHRRGTATMTTVEVGHRLGFEPVCCGEDLLSGATKAKLSSWAYRLSKGTITHEEFLAKVKELT